MYDDEQSGAAKDSLTGQLFRAVGINDRVPMNRTENMVGVLVLITGALVFFLGVGFVVFVCAVLLIEGGVGRAVGIAGLVGLSIAVLVGLRHWIRRTS